MPVAEAGLISPKHSVRWRLTMRRATDLSVHEAKVTIDESQAARRLAP